MTVSKVSCLSQLTDREFDLLKAELSLLEQRIIHHEGLQYRLRQFSVILWTLALGLGFGVASELAKADIRLVAASAIVPLLFLYLDAWYARVAQRFRTRHLAIAAFVNRNVASDEVKNLSADDIRKIELLDLTAHSTRKDSASARYRENLVVKITRTVRISFYGFQIVSTGLLLVVLGALGDHHYGYWIWGVFLLAAVPFLFFVNYLVWRSTYRTLSFRARADDKDG
jgi:hypothetical protein